ncbi:arginase family protein [Butyrivibrio sp. VCD2006]|uniref:arginase family protein n=1 Tax=Butyrivibrio sp. VCD2006 TaxID=1280664 RepID=UPI000415B547|nr:arginase family protein [Butyrivibrio sp. VCD2006]
MNVTVYDFTGIYENESFDFYKKEGARSLFCSLKDISGTNCICDDYAFEEIRGRIKACESEGEWTIGKEPAIRFFDNGNYHYMSRILMEDLCEKDRVDGTGESGGFDLIVFDHHPDMKWTSFGEILSCGCWVLRALKDIPGISNVYIVGADSKLMEEAYQDNPEVRDRVFYFEDFSALKEELQKAGKDAAKKVYISVDKDVLSRDELLTNWDQGDMSLEELKDALIFIKEYYGDNILAVDVCGECDVDAPEAFGSLGFEAGNRINDCILSVFS